MTTAHGGATIYYTTDGSAPTAASNIYTGPFTLTIPPGGSITLRVTDSATLGGDGPSDSGTAVYRGYGFKPGDSWYADNDPNPVQGFTGNLIAADGKYYRAGQWMLGGTDIEAAEGVWLYSTPDLYNWHYESQILGLPAGWQEVSRPHIVYNASTQQYVLWAHLIAYNGNPEFPTANAAGIATAPAITGPWAWVNTNYNPGHGYKDCNLFEDADGTAYTVATDGSQQNMWVYRLASDYLSAVAAAQVDATSGWESPVLFRRGSTYFLITGASDLYVNTLNNFTNQSYQTAGSPLGPWTAKAPLFASNPQGTLYNGQPTSVFQIPGKQDGWIYMADNWTGPAVAGSTHLWLPLTFSDATHAQVQTPATWDLSYFP